MSQVLALDISASCTGIAVFDNIELIHTSTIKTKSKDSYGQRLAFFEASLYDIFEQFKISEVVIEDLFRGVSFKAFKVLCLFHSIAYKVAYEMGINPSMLAVLKVRRLLGESLDCKVKGKDQVFFILNDAFGLQLEFRKGNDITDAIALGLAHLTNEGIDCQVNFNYNEFKRFVGEENGPISDIRPKPKRKQRGSKKSIQTVSKKVSSG